MSRADSSKKTRRRGDAGTRGRKSQGFETPTESLDSVARIQAGFQSPSEFFLRVSHSPRPRVLEPQFVA